MGEVGENVDIFQGEGGEEGAGETKFGQIQVWPSLVTKFAKPSSAKTKFGQDQVWPDQVRNINIVRVSVKASPAEGRRCST